MSFWVVVLGAVGQAMLALLLFMLGAFGLNQRLLNFSLYAFPLLCVTSIGMVVYQYANDGSPSAYWWYALPFVCATAYTLYVRGN